MPWNSHRDENNEDLLRANKEWATLRFPGILPQKVPLPGTLSCSDWLAVTGEGIGKAKFIIWALELLILIFIFQYVLSNKILGWFFFNHTYFVRMKLLCQLTKERFLRLFSSFPLSQSNKSLRHKLKRRSVGWCEISGNYYPSKQLAHTPKFKTTQQAGTMGALTKHQKTVCSRPLKRPSMNYLEACCL